jgi:hypothetical protein
VATAVSSLHNQHQWEGIVLKHAELVRYKSDDQALLNDFFIPVLDIHDRATGNSLEDEEVENAEVKNLLASLLDEKIDPITLRQGKCILFLNDYYCSIFLFNSFYFTIIILQSLK